MNAIVGFIVEDKSDLDIVNELTKKAAKKPFTVRYFSGRGCGRLRSQCSVWANNLRLQGCNRLIVLHDLDNENLSDLEKTLKGALGASPISPTILVIPVREIEAWLLADEAALSKTFQMKKPAKAVPNPETIVDPKAQLRKVIKAHSKNGIDYLSTVHGVKLAANCSLARLRRCASFAPLEAFAKKYL